jgi:endonuclease III
MEKLVKMGMDYFETPKKDIDYINDEKAKKLIVDFKNFPHAYVLACLMARRIKAEKAWLIPQKIYDNLNTFDIYELSKFKLEKYKKIFNQEKLHIYNNDMANIFFCGIQDIIKKYNGNASKIWHGNPSSSTVVYRFLEFKGCGIKIATMATNILARDYKIKFSDFYSIDVSPDVHIMRVMERMGYVPKNASKEMVIYKARDLNPEFPGIIDYPCWEIGRNWCKPNNPECNNCKVKSECKKVI